MRLLFSLNTKSMNQVHAQVLACKSVGHPTNKSKCLRFESALRTGIYFPTLQKMFKILLHQSKIFSMIIACWYKSYKNLLGLSTFVFPFKINILLLSIGPGGSETRKIISTSYLIVAILLVSSS